MKRKTVWSLGGDVDVATIEKHCTELKEQYRSLEKDNFIFKKVQKAFYFSLVPFSVGWIAAFITFNFMYLFPGTLLALMIFSYYGLQKRGFVYDIAKYSIAKRLGFNFDPLPNISLWKSLRLSIPEIFNLFPKSNIEFIIDDQYYGSLQSKGKVIPFHSGVFYGAHDTKRRSDLTFTFFALKLDRKFKHKVLLHPKKSFLNLLGSQTSFRKNISFESNEFNRVFSLDSDRIKQLSITEALKIITPSMQLRLLKLYASKNSFKILFKDNFVVFLFINDFLRFAPSGLFKLNLREDIIIRFKEDLQDLSSLALEVAEKLET